MTPTGLDFGLDSYDLNARLKPALFAVLPALLVVAVWSPTVWTVSGGLLGLFVTCGSTYLMSRVARYLGRRVEEDMIAADGPLPSVRALRHRDTILDGQTKARYHAYLRLRGILLPSAEQELLDPVAADGDYASASKHLLELTRDRKRFPLIFKENVDYGFRRNAVGLRGIALAIIILALAFNTVGFALQLFQGGGANWAAVALELVLIACLCAWTFVVNLDFVRDAAVAYAIRLLAACEGLGTSAR